MAEARTGSAGQSSGDRRGGLEAGAAPEAAASAGAKALSSGRRRAAPAEATISVAADKADGAARSPGSPVTEAGGSAQQAEAAATEQFWPALALSLSTDNGTVATKRAAKRPPRDKASGADALPRRDSPLPRQTCTLTGAKADLRAGKSQRRRAHTQAFARAWIKPPRMRCIVHGMQLRCRLPYLRGAALTVPVAGRRANAVQHAASAARATDPHRRNVGHGSSNVF